MKKIKLKLRNFIYKYITKWYIRLTNKRNWNLIPIKGDEYTYVFNKFEGCNYGVMNSIECVYFALIETYKNIIRLQIQGIRMDYSDEKFIQVDIDTCRPGLIIGRYGKDIDALAERLTKYFNKKTIVNLNEIKIKVISTGY